MGILNRVTILMALAVPALAVASPALAATSAARHYDCSKPGNANKAACKVGGAAAPATPASTTRTSVTTTTTARHYDCTKAGNAKKAACRTAAAQTPAGNSPGAVKTTTTSTGTTTDCTKWYNKGRAACRTTTSSSPARTTTAPAPRPAPANTNTRPAAPRSGTTGENNNPAGASAQCKDGTYSHSAHHSGACSHHGGVAKWLS